MTTENTRNQSSSSVGVVIAGCDRDLHLVQGALESVRYFMPDTPICLIFDGESDLSALQDAYSLQVLRKDNTCNSFLRDRSYGYGLTKMVAFWESPFEEFLYFDSDACVWGDLLERYPLGSDQILIPSTNYEFNEASIGEWFFDCNYIKALDPLFDPLKCRHLYFCTGTFIARRHIFDLDCYRYLLDAKAEDPTRFLYGEMGMLNYMILSLAQRGSLAYSSLPFQYVNSEYDWFKTRAAFPFKGFQPDGSTRDPIILHYAGPKPYVFNDVYSTPMRYFRVNAKLRLNPRLSRAQALLEVIREDYHYFIRLEGRPKLALAIQRLSAKLSRRFFSSASAERAGDGG